MLAIRVKKAAESLDASPAVRKIHRMAETPNLCSGDSSPRGLTASAGERLSERVALRSRTPFGTGRHGNRAPREQGRSQGLLK